MSDSDGNSSITELWITSQSVLMVYSSKDILSYNVDLVFRIRILLRTTKFNVRLIFRVIIHRRAWYNTFSSYGNFYSQTKIETDLNYTVRVSSFA